MPSLRQRSTRGAAAALLVLLAAALGSARAGTGGIDFRSTFDDGTIGPWGGVQREFDRPLGESFRIVRTPARQGGAAAMFTVRQGYSAFGYNEATELCCGPETPEAEGSDYWYAWSTLFPEGWSIPYRWGIFLQWHSDWGLPPPLDFTAGKSVSLQLHTGAVKATDCSTVCGWEFERSVPVLKTLELGAWHDFVLHVHWSAYPRGSVEVWHRLAPEARFKKVATVRGVPTMQRFGSKVAGMYTLLGFYRGSYCGEPTELGCTSERGTQPDTVVYHDEFRRSTIMFPWCLACRARR